MSLVYHAFRISEQIIARLPISVSKKIARGAGTLYYYLFPRKRGIIKKNMRRALGPDASERVVARTARSACRYYAEYWIDIMWLPTQSREYILERFSKINEEPLIEIVKAGKGVIVVLPHFGSWEAGAVYLSSLGPFAAVAEVLKPPELFDFFVRLRAGVGIEIFPYDSREETRENMVRALKAGKILALLCDRDLKGTGVEVNFFGEKTTLPPGPAVLALKSGSPIVCVNVRNLGPTRWVGRVTEPIYVSDSGERDKVIRETMQLIANRLEGLIRDAPAQWHMFMPAWPSDRR